MPTLQEYGQGILDCIVVTLDDAGFPVCKSFLSPGALPALDEEWRAVPGYEGQYEVSNCGGVRSVDRTMVDRRGQVRRLKGKRLAAAPDGAGYPLVQLSSRPRKAERVHVLMMLAFVGDRPYPGAEVRHLNDEKTDNRLENLTWGTRQQNMWDRSANGRDRNRNKTHCDRGHAFDNDNTYYSAEGYRACRACREWRKFAATAFSEAT